MMPPPPPSHLVPPMLQRDPPVKISDIRKERRTDDEAREELAEYFIFRFEKVDEGGGYDSSGEKRKSTWERVIRTEVSGVSNKEAARRVRELNQYTLTASQKKATLDGAQQRQLEKVLEDLRARDNPLVQTHLVQIDHQIRPKEKEKERGREKERNRKASRHGRDLSVKELKRRAKSKDRKKVIPEETSLTAYYKRSLRPEVDALAILYQREAHQRRMLQPPNPQVVIPPQNFHHPESQPRHDGPGVRQVRPLGNQGQAGPDGPGFGSGNVAKVVNGGGRKPDKKYDDHRPPKHHEPPMSPGSSESSIFSSGFSDMDDDRSISTSPTSSLSSRESFERTRPKGSRYIERPRHFGIQTNYLPHQSRRFVEHRISDDGFPPQAPVPPPMPKPLIDIEQIRSSAYERGRADERNDRRELAETVAHASAEAVAKARLPPRIIQPPASGVRTIRARDIDPLLEENALNRLRLEDEYNVPDSRRIWDHEEHRAGRDDVWRLDGERALQEQEREVKRRARDPLYVRRRESDVPFAETNPFTPRPGLNRRMSTSGYTERRRVDDYDGRSY